MSLTKDILFQTYQIDNCIKKNEDETYYYGFHTGMEKEILILIRQKESMDDFNMTEGISCFPYVMDFHREKNNSCIIMNCVKGVFFHKYMEQEASLSERQLVAIGLDICSILQEFRHRKLSGTKLWELHNVMLTSDSKICFLGRNGIGKKESAFEVKKENLKAALEFLRCVCTDQDSVFYKVIKKDYSNVRSLKKAILNIARKTARYKKMVWMQRVCYIVIMAMFLVSVLLLRENGEIYQDHILWQEGLSQMEQKEYTAAIATFEELLKKDQDNQQIRRFIADCYFSDGDMEKAEQCYRKNLEDFQDIYSLERVRWIIEDKAHSAYNLRDYDRVLDFCEELSETGSTIGTDEMRLNIYLMRNDFASAKELIKYLEVQENVDESLRLRMTSAGNQIQLIETLIPQYSEIANILEAEDWPGLIEKLNSQEYKELCEQYGDIVYCPYKEDQFIKLFKNGSVYLGQMDQDQRSGTGTLALTGFASNNLLIFEGEWKNDYPNGEGVQKVLDLSYLEDGRNVWMSTSGKYENGYADGEMKIKFYEEADSGIMPLRTAIYRSSIGYMERYDGDVDTGSIDSRYYVAAVFDDGEFLLQHFGHVDAVAGVGLRECHLAFNWEKGK